MASFGVKTCRHVSQNVFVNGRFAVGPVAIIWLLSAKLYQTLTPTDTQQNETKASEKKMDALSISACFFFLLSGERGRVSAFATFLSGIFAFFGVR